MYNNTYGYPAFMPGWQPPQQSGATDIQGVRWVSGIDEVNATTVPTGMRSMFMDQTKNVFYIKDGAAVKAFEFKEIKPPAPEDFVTRTEFEKLRSEYERLVQQQNAATAVNQPVANDADVQWQSSAGQGAAMPADSGYGNDQAGAGVFPG